LLFPGDVEISYGDQAMKQSRINAFTAILKDQPDNEMIWYGLANEYMMPRTERERLSILRANMREPEPRSRLLK